MSLLYIFAASGFEARPVERIAEASNPGSPLRCGPNDVVLIVCGMGPQNARSKAEKVFADGKPDAALVIGLCGGLKTSLPEGTIVSYTDCLSTDPASPTPHVLSRYRRYGSESEVRWDRVRFCCRNHISPDCDDTRGKGRPRTIRSGSCRYGDLCDCGRCQERRSSYRCPSRCGRFNRSRFTRF